MATVPIPTTKLCLSTACVSHRLGGWGTEGGGLGGSLQGMRVWPWSRARIRELGA